MALIKCPECGKEFSSFAKACPNCSCPTDVILIQTAELQKSNGDVEETLSTQISASEDLTDTFEPTSSEEENSSDVDVVVDLPSMQNEIASGFSNPNVLAVETFYGIRRALDPQTFYRDALLDLVEDEGTPPDIFDATFEDAVESNKHLASFIGNVTGSYTAQIGYDMERTWTEYQNGRAVQRKEKYIDWQPFEGDYSGKQQVPKSLRSDPLDEDIEVAYNVMLKYTDLEAEQIPTDDVVVPSQTIIDDAMEDCKNKASLECEKNLPGNHQKGYSFSGFAQLDHYVCHTIPTFSIPFTYRGEEYRKSFFAMERHLGNSFGKIPEISDEINAAVDKKLRPLGVVAIVFLSLSMLVALTLGALHEFMVRELGLALSLPIFGIGVLSTIAYWISHKAYKKHIIRANLEAKVKAVDRVLAEKGLPPLSQEEKQEYLGRASK